MTDEYAMIVIGAFSFSILIWLIMLCFLLHWSVYQHSSSRHIAPESNLHGTQAVSYVPDGASDISGYDEDEIPRVTLV